MADSYYYNPEAAALAAQVANQTAMIAYYNAQLDFQRYQFEHLSAYQKEQIALQKAQDAWRQKYEEALLTGYYKGTPTLEREKAQNETTLGYLNLLSQLRGPANYFQYLKVLNATPQGMRDLVSAAAGKYAMAGYGGAAPEATTEPVSVQTLLSDITGAGQATSQASNQTGSQAASAGSASQALPSPSQWSAENWNKMTPTQRDLLLGYYESQGWRPEDVQALFKASLPKYQAPQSGQVRI